MEVKKFNKQTDYDELCNWWEDWGLPIHPKEALSENGIVISKDGINICSGFIYSTDSYITWFEFVIINKKTTKQQREGVLVKLLDCMVEKAKSMGFKIIMCFGLEEQDKVSPVLVKWRKENIGDMTVKNISHHYKIIN